MIKIKDILEHLQAQNIQFEFIGNPNDSISGFSSLGKYKPGTVTWCKKKENLPPNYNELGYRLIVVPAALADPATGEAATHASTGRATKQINTIITPDHKKIFFIIIEHFFNKNRLKPGIGQGTYVSPDVTIGKNVTIGHNCVIDGEITIGDNTVIYNGVNMINRIHIGQNCTIHSGCNLGHDDYSYTEDADHNKTMIRHYGGIEIQDDVFIGPDCVINRGTIDDTIIGRGSKLDAQCHISHNVSIGAKSALISGTKLYGSVKTGENAYIASAIVMNQLELGQNVTVGMGSVVMKNVPDNTTVVGTPAKPLDKKK